MVNHLRLAYSDMPAVGYNVIKDLVSSITRGKNFKNFGMKDYKPVYSNEDVPWPKDHLDSKNGEEDNEAMDTEGMEPGSPRELPSLS